MRSAYLAACLLPLLTQFAHSQRTRRSPPEGQIVGTVIDQDGKPVSKVWVSTSDFLPPSIETEFTSGPGNSQAKLTQEGASKEFSRLQAFSRPVETNGGMTGNDGVFQIQGLELGAYVLLGENEEDAYPLTDLTFTDGTPSLVTLSRGSSVAHVVVRLAEKGGVVSGSITDTLTGQPVRAGVSIFRADDNEQLLASSAQPTFRIVLPAHVEVRVVFSAAGYKSLTVPMRLDSGQQQAHNVEVTPQAKDASPDQRILRVVPQASHPVSEVR